MKRLLVALLSWSLVIVCVAEPLPERPRERDEEAWAWHRAHLGSEHLHVDCWANGEVWVMGKKLEEADWGEEFVFLHKDGEGWEKRFGGYDRPDGRRFVFFYEEEGVDRALTGRVAKSLKAAGWNDIMMSPLPADLWVSRCYEAKTRVPDIEPPVVRRVEVPQWVMDTRIVIHVYEDGTIADIKGRKEGRIFKTEEEIEKYLAKRKAEVEKKIEGKEVWGKPLKPEVRIRGDRNVEFRHIRKVTKASAKAGVAKVVFAPVDKKDEAKKKE